MAERVSETGRAELKRPFVFPRNSDNRSNCFGLLGMIKYQQALSTVPLLPGNADALNKVDHNFHLFAFRALTRRVSDLVPRGPDSLQFGLVLLADVAFFSQFLNKPFGGAPLAG